MTFTTSAEFEIVSRIKERRCYVSFNPIKEEMMHEQVLRFVQHFGGYGLRIVTLDTVSSLSAILSMACHPAFAVILLATNT